MRDKSVFVAVILCVAVICIGAGSVIVGIITARTMKFRQGAMMSQGNDNTVTVDEGVPRFRGESVITPSSPAQSLVVSEWEHVWGRLWRNEAVELSERGHGKQEIISLLNPVAAARVAEVLKMDAREVQRVVDEYYGARKKALAPTR